MLHEKTHEDKSNVRGMNLCDSCEGELAAETIPIAAVKDGLNMSCLKCTDGELVFFDAEYFAPLTELLKEGFLNMSVRVREDGQRYIAVKDGFVLVAVILPLKVVDDKYLDALHDFLIMCSEQLDRQKAREKEEKEKEGAQQMELETVVQETETPAPEKKKGRKKTGGTE